MVSQPGRTVVVFGAGATKACGGPLTDEILPDALAVRARLARPDHLDAIEAFLTENFHLPPRTRRRPEHYPPLPLLLSLVDTALDRRDAFAPQWTPERLREVRTALEYAIFAILEYRLRTIRNHYATFLDLLYRAAAAPEQITVISLNYDLIADNSVPQVGESHQRWRALPDYGCDIATPVYREVERFGRLLKIHGSLNWLYCPNCQRLDLGVAPSGRTVKVLEELYMRENLDLNDKYSSGRAPCRDCGTFVEPILITPTSLKDYRNPHIARVWYEAARDLREARRAIFVGYSMPADDVEVIYLFKRGLAELDPRQITVVEQPSRGKRALDTHPAGRQYRAVFGNRIDWQPLGFERWIDAGSRRAFASAAAPTRRRRSPAPV